MKCCESLLKLLGKYDFSFCKVCFVSDIDCEIYRIKLESPFSVGRREAISDVVLRIYPKEKSVLENIQSEVAWLNELSNDGVYVPTPILNKNGRFINEVINTDGTTQYAIVLSWLAGQFLDKSLTVKNLAQIGALLSKLHRGSKKLNKAGKLNSTRESFECDFDLWISEGRSSTCYVSTDLLKYAGATARIVQENIAKMDQNSCYYGFIHGDLHQWNYLFENNVAGAIDFSDCGWGHYAYDFATILLYLKFPLVDNYDHRRKYNHLRYALLSSYDKYSSLPADIESQIDIYIMGKLLSNLEWILDDWGRPDRISWGPRFLEQVASIFRGYTETAN